jgi:homoserine kinase
MIRLRLPATSANLGPGFDAVGLAMALYLTIDASAHAADFAIAATGRDAALCARTDNNLIFETYRGVLTSAGRPITPLRLRVHNEIPLGMGCGSSAAALLGGVMLANQFGALGWSLEQCMAEACRREGHPDNVAACALGYLTVSAVENNEVLTATCGQALPWKLLLALPSASLATEKARALLPTQYSRADAVANVQRTALLVSAFALDRPDLLRVAMQDRIHQPYRMEACPLLGRLLPLVGQPGGRSGIWGVALSGAGPGILLIAAPDADTAALTALVSQAADGPGPENANSALEILETSIGGGVTQQITGPA